MTCYRIQGLDTLRVSTLADVHAKSAAAISARRPLVRKSNKAAAVKLYNPRFEEEYVAGKDFDPDRCEINVLCGLCACRSRVCMLGPAPAMRSTTDFWRGIRQVVSAPPH